MNKLSKILLVLVIILTIAQITMTILFFNMKKVAYNDFIMYENEKEHSEFLEKQLEEYKQDNQE